MVDYTEFPTDPVINVHWKSKDPDDGDPDTPPHDFRMSCGAFQNGILHGIPISFSGFYVLSSYHMYMMMDDTTPGRLPTKPISYYPCFEDYSWFTTNREFPYIWSVPDSWTIEWGGVGAGNIAEFRHCNPQVFSAAYYSGLGADVNHGSVAQIPRSRPGDEEWFYYDPIIVFEFYSSVFNKIIPHPYPRALVQAHCVDETPGFMWFDTDNNPGGTSAACLAMMPPQPPGWGTFFDPSVTYEYPTPGSTEKPLKEHLSPPSPLSQRRERLLHPETWAKVFTPSPHRPVRPQRRFITED